LLGLLIGFFWTLHGDALLTLLYVLAGLALASAFAAWFGVSEAKRTLTTLHVAKHEASLVSRIRESVAYRIPIPFFPKRPRPTRSGLSRFRKWAREELHHELPLILAASFLFNLSANLYNISYTPYLYSAGLAASAIFLVNLSNSFTQSLVFPLTGTLSNRIGPDRLVQRATYLRSLGYLATAGFTFVIFTHPAAFEANVIVFGILGGAIAVYTTASSLMLFRSLAGRDAGSLLGVNSALGGVAAIAGAGLSGILSVYGSYRLVFLVAGAALLVSLPLWTAASVAWVRRRHADPSTDLPGPSEPTSSSIERSAAAKTH